MSFLNLSRDEFITALSAIEFALRDEKFVRNGMMWEIFEKQLDSGELSKNGFSQESIDKFWALHKKLQLGFLTLQREAGLMKISELGISPWMDALKAGMVIYRRDWDSDSKRLWLNRGILFISEDGKTKQYDRTDKDEQIEWLGLEEIDLKNDVQEAIDRAFSALAPTKNKSLYEMSFKFKIGDELVILVSKESGKVIGRAEYTNIDNQYLLRYCDALGVARESWWDESALRKSLVVE